MKLSSIFVFLIVLANFYCRDEYLNLEPVPHKPDTTKPVIPTPVNTACYPDYSNCNGYWICIRPLSFQNINYTYNGGYFHGAFGAATSHGTKMFFGGGHEEGYIGFTNGVVNIYDSERNLWATTNLSIPRSHLTAVSCRDKVLFAGGNDLITAITPPPYGGPSTYYATVDIYEEGISGHGTATLSEARSDLASVSDGTKAYFIGGKNFNTYSAKMDIYDSENNSWKAVNLPRARAFGGAVATGNKIYIAGGQNQNGNLTIADVYDSKNQSWSELEVPHIHPVSAMAFASNKIIIAGGDGLKSKWVDIYDLSTSKWQSTELSDSRYNIAIASANGKVIFLGGNYSCNIDIYNTLTGEWSLTQLSDGVSGVAAASTGNQCGFMGFLYNHGNAIPQTAIMITP